MAMEGVKTMEKSQDGGGSSVDSTGLCPGIEKLHIHDHGFYGYNPSGNIAMEKTLWGVDSADPYSFTGIGDLHTHGSSMSTEKSQCGGSTGNSADPCPVYSWSLVDPLVGNPDPGAHARAIVADEMIAEERKAIVLEVFAIDKDDYDFIVVDYMIRALNPLRRIFTDLLNRFDVWPYQIIPSIYAEMRSSRRFLIVMLQDFEQIFRLAEYLFALHFNCNVVYTPEIPKMIAELRQMIKDWVDNTDW